MRLINTLPFLFFIGLGIILYASLTPAAAQANKLAELKLTLDNGEILNLADLKGKPYIIRFFASWCSFCRKDAPILIELSKRIGGPIIGIAVDDTKEKVASLKNLPYNYVVIDNDNHLKKLLKNRAIPETIIVDPEGKIVSRYSGAIQKLKER